MGCSSVILEQDDTKLQQKIINLNTNTLHHKKDLIHAQSLIYLYHKLIYDTGACLYINPTIVECFKSVLYKISYDLKGNFNNCQMEYIEDPPYLDIKNRINIKNETNELIINYIFI